MAPTPHEPRPPRRKTESATDEAGDVRGDAPGGSSNPSNTFQPTIDGKPRSGRVPANPQQTRIGQRTPSRPHPTRAHASAGNSTIPHSGRSRAAQTARTSGASSTLSPNPTGDAPAFGSRYRVAGELGRGGLGLVLDAADDRIGRDLAIKVLLRPQGRALTRFVDEARITGQLEHPNIIPVYDLGEDDEQRPFMAMKRVRGQTLTEIVRELAAANARATVADLRRDRRLEIFLKVCDAIDYAHSRRVIHRDLKPDNVMVGEFGEVLVMDWGLARLLDAPLETLPDDPDTGANIDEPRAVHRADDNAQLTMEGDVIGTPAFMPPEQAHGEIGKMGPHSDVFALGAILYYMLTFAPPYRGSSVFQVMALAAQAKWQPPRTKAPQARIPRGLDAIVCRAMAAAPADRYESVAAMRDDIRAFMADEPIVARRDPLSARIGKWIRRHPRLTQASVLLVFAGLVIAMLISQLQASRAQTDAADARAEAAAQLAASAERERQLRAQLYTLDNKKMEALAEFRQRFHEAMRRGMSASEMLANVGEARIRQYIAAYDEFFHAMKAAGEAIDSMDYVMYALLYDAGMGMAKESVELLTELLEQDQELVIAWYNRGLGRVTLGDDEGALADFAEVLAREPDHYAAHCDLGAIEQRRGHLDKALDHFNRALEIHPQHVWSLRNRGIVRWKLGHYDEAVADYNAAIAANPDFWPARISRARAHLAQGRPAYALNDLDYILQRAPAHTGALFEKARALTALQRREEAVELYTTLLEREPDNLFARANRGGLFTNLGHPEKGLEDFDRVLELDPDFVFALFNRGSTHNSLGNHDRAIADFTRLLELTPRDWQARLRRAGAYEALGDGDRALADYRGAWPSVPDDMRPRVRRSIETLGGTVPD